MPLIILNLLSTFGVWKLVVLALYYIINYVICKFEWCR